jgi:hypothetical protein
VIRFAAIPKCASRTLKAHGLLGATNAEPHLRVTAFPFWERITWQMVVRDSASWLVSWWHEANRAEGDFCQRLGMRFHCMDEDLSLLKAPPRIDKVSKAPGFNSWIPENFRAAYEPFGGDFHAFCIATITDGVKCIPVAIQDLDAWLIARGYEAAHINARKL